MAKTEPKITRAWKGFDKDLKCKGHQFEVGKEYKVGGTPVICGHGFHACTLPLDVLRYYPPCTSRFAEVELIGATKTNSEDSKACALKIRIVREISYVELWAAHKATVAAQEGVTATTGDSAHASSTGYYAHASST